MAQLLELNKSKPRGKESEILLAEITRLESALTVTRDDQVRVFNMTLTTVLTNLMDRGHAKRGSMA